MIRVAVIGAGHWGPNLIRNFYAKELSRVAWVVDRDEARLEQARASYPDVRLGRDPLEAIADDTVDAVVVAMA